MMEGWLCPALFRYFPSAPREIYVKVEPLGSGVQAKSGRSTNGHFYSKLFSEVRKLDRLTLYEAPRHTKRTEGLTEQHHGRSTIGDSPGPFASETGNDCAV
jgi:hypothetical protein